MVAFSFTLSQPFVGTVKSGENSSLLVLVLEKPLISPTAERFAIR